MLTKYMRVMDDGEVALVEIDPETLTCVESTIDDYNIKEYALERCVCGLCNKRPVDAYSIEWYSNSDFHDWGKLYVCNECKGGSSLDSDIFNIIMEKYNN